MKTQYEEIDKIIYSLYNDGYTLRHISELILRDHHFVKRRLVANGIQIENHKTKKPYSEEHKRKISESNKGRKSWNVGMRLSREMRIKNMINHIKYDIDYDWVDSFEDIEKVIYLNHSIIRKRDYDGFTTDMYKSFIEKFYYDEKFNQLYNKWLKTKDKWIKPSLDHIVAKSSGGCLFLENLQFVSWFENRAKTDIPLDVWNKMKNNIQYYL